MCKLHYMGRRYIYAYITITLRATLAVESPLNLRLDLWPMTYVSQASVFAMKCKSEAFIIKPRLLDCILIHFRVMATLLVVRTPRDCIPVQEFLALLL